MYGWIRWRDAGHVDRLGDEGIATEFFHVIIPVAARPRSRYLFRDHGEPVFVEIPLDRRSLVLGYARTPCWLGGWMLGFAGAVQGHWAIAALGVGLMAIAAVLTFGLGRLPAPERDRRLLLQRVNGFGMPPELMSPQMRDQQRDALAARWYDEHGVDWKTAIARGEASEVLVAIAEYDRSRALVARARRNMIDAEGN